MAARSSKPGRAAATPTAGRLKFEVSAFLETPPVDLRARGIRYANDSAIRCYLGVDPHSLATSVEWYACFAAMYSSRLVRFCSLDDRNVWLVMFERHTGRDVIQAFANAAAAHVPALDSIRIVPRWGDLFHQ